MKDAKASKDLPGFGSRLRDLRKQRNLSQTELGTLAGLHFTNISRYERGEAHPNSDTLKRMADALGVSGDYLLEGTVAEAAKANFEDRELLLQFKEVDRLPAEDKEFVKKVLDALLVKKKVQDLARS